MCILPIASGKGGVGKTTLAANLAVSLGDSGKKVILADLDFGGSNLNLMLGLQPHTATIGDYIRGHVDSASDLLVPSGYPNVDFIPGNIRPLGLTDIRVEQKRRLIRDLCTLKADYLVVDLGAGSSLSVVDFFLLSKNSIIVTAPENVSIASSYVLLKSMVFRMMVSCFGIDSEGWKFLQSLNEGGVSAREIHIGKINRKLHMIDPENFQRFRSIHASFCPRLVLNLVDSPEEANKGNKLYRYVRHYLGLNMDYLGVILRDDIQNHAVSGGLPVVLYKPQGIISRGILRITKSLLSTQERTSHTPEQVDDFCMSAFSNAQKDYELKMNSLEGFYKGKDISDAELLEILKNQQYEVNQLRKENRFLKRKLFKDLKK